MSRIILFTIIAVFLSGCTNNVAQRTVDEYNNNINYERSLLVGVYEEGRKADVREVQSGF